MAEPQTLNLPIGGMDCAECALHVEDALRGLPGVESAIVYLAAEKAIVRIDPGRVSMEEIRSAVSAAGYSVADSTPGESVVKAPRLVGAGSFRALGLVFGVVLFVVVVGERLGLLEAVTDFVPWPLWLLIMIVGGYPVLRNVVLATMRRRVISHTLMTVGVLAAIAVGEWATAVVVIFFMRVGDHVESFTTESARDTIRGLGRLAPRMARLATSDDGDEIETEVPIERLNVGDVVVVRPGEQIPADGEVVDGRATVDQASITGESMPVEAGAGSRVYAATTATLGSLRVRVTGVGADTTFGRVIKLVEEAEGNRAVVQRVADRFSGYFLPVVAVVAFLTMLLRRDPIAAAAVLVVACSCSFALATPIAVLASVGASARRGLLFKGGKYLEALASAQVLLIDKTGTLTLGRPEVTRIVPLGDTTGSEVLRLAASAERYSEHPLAAGIRDRARSDGLSLSSPKEFVAEPGVGVSARVDGGWLRVATAPISGLESASVHAAEMTGRGETALVVEREGVAIGLIGLKDTMRGEVPEALREIRGLGIERIELLTGDNELTARTLSDTLGVEYRAGLLPEDKIAIVREYQGKGFRVAMVGDGVNDAPALAQADVGIALGSTATNVAMEAAHVVLLRDDWRLVVEAFKTSHRTMRVIRSNVAFTIAYNTIGLTLAALGFLPPAIAAAAQSLPDVGILANSSRLLKQA